METRVCTFCGIEKPLTKTYFEKARVRKDGSIALRAKCIECRRKDLYKWRKENPEKNKEPQRSSKINTDFSLTKKYYKVKVV